MYRFEINWNGKLAAKGWSTSSMLSEIIRSAVVGNFVNVDLCDKPPCGPWPSVDDLLLSRGPISGYCSDTTGRLTWSAEAVGRAGE